MHTCAHYVYKNCVNVVFNFHSISESVFFEKNCVLPHRVNHLSIGVTQWPASGHTNFDFVRCGCPEVVELLWAFASILRPYRPPHETRKGPIGDSHKWCESLRVCRFDDWVRRPMVVEKLVRTESTLGRSKSSEWYCKLPPCAHKFGGCEARKQQFT